MRSLRRLVTLLLALPLCLGVLIAGVLAWLQWGSGAAVLGGLAGRFVAGLTVQDLALKLPHEVSAARIALADEGGIWLDIAAPKISFDLTALLRREAHLHSLSARQITLARLPASEAEAREGKLLPSLPRLPVAVRLDRLAIDEIAFGDSILGQAFRISAAGKAALPQGRLAADITLTRLDAPGRAALQLDIAPQAERLFARLEISEPPGGVLASALGAAAEPAQVMLRLEGPARGAALHAEARLGGAAEAALAGSISADAQGAGFARLSGHIAAAPLLPAPWTEALRRLEFSLDASRNQAGVIRFRDIKASAPAGEVTLSGTLDPKREEAALHGSVALGASPLLAGILPEQLGFEAARARFEVHGALSAPKLVLEAGLQGFTSSIAELSAALGTSPQLHLKASAPRRIESLTLTGAGAELTAAGDIGETLDLSFALRLAELSRVVPGLAGALTAEGQVRGARDDPSLSLQARGESITRGAEVLAAPELVLRLETLLSHPRAEARLNATYAGLPLTLTLLGRPEGAALRLHQLDAAFGPARLTGSGLLDVQKPLFEGALSLAIPDLAPFTPLLGRQVTGAIALEAEGQSADGAQQISAKFSAPNITLDGRGLAMEADFNGGLAAARARLEARYGDAKLTSAASLASTNEAQLLTLEELTLTQGAEQVKLTAPARITLAPDGRISMAEANLTSNRGGRLKLEGFWSNQEIALDAALNALPIAAFAALAVPEAQLAGTLSGSAKVTGSAAEPRFEARLESPAISSAQPAARGVPPLRLVASASGSMAGAEARLALNGGNVVRLAANARLGGLTPDAALTGSVTGRLDLGALAQPLLAAGAQRVGGTANLNIQLAGTLATPRLGGQANIANGSFRDLQHGVALNDITATIAAEDQRLNLTGFAARTSGGGRIGGTGALDLGKPRLPFDLRLTADAARPVNADLGNATLDGEVRVAGEVLGESRLSGKLLVRRAELRIPDKLPSSIRGLPGVRERGQRPPGVQPLAPPAHGDVQDGNLPPIALDLTIEAPRAIFLRGRGLDAELGGTVRVAGILNAPVLEGGFMLRRGTLSVLDRRLDLNRANISFDAGGIMPHLDVAATTRAEEVEITVALEGPARDPKISFTSTPELPADEVLARLLFGRRGGDLSPFQMLQLAEALSGATGRPLPGPGGLMERIRRTLALDRLSIGQEKEGEQRPGEEPGATLETGRYVADGVFLGVKQSADGGPPRVGVQIDLMPRVRLEAESGGNSLAGDRVGIGFEYEY
jgi:translocation and assembly module TamB